jgi:hypothetical protein
MTGFIVSVFAFRNRVSSKEAFEGLELGEGKLSRPVLRGTGGREAAWLLGNNPKVRVADHSPRASSFCPHNSGALAQHSVEHVPHESHSTRGWFHEQNPTEKRNYWSFRRILVSESYVGRFIR